MVKRNILIVGITSFIAVTASVVALANYSNNGMIFRADDVASSRSLVVSLGEDSNLYCKNPNKSGDFYTYYTVSNVGSRFLLYITKEVESGLSEGDKVTATSIGLGGNGQSVEMRSGDTDSYFGRIANIESVTFDFVANVRPYVYYMYPSDSNGKNTGGIQLTSGEPVEFPTNSKGEYPDRFRFKSTANNTAVTSITINYTC